MKRKNLLTISEAMAHAGVSRNTFEKYLEVLEVSVKKPGIGTKSHFVTYQVAENIRLLKENPLLLEELKRSAQREAIRDALLALVKALIPDELYDPVDDPRQVEAVEQLAAFLDSTTAAEGIAEGLTLLLAQNPLLIVPIVHSESVSLSE